MMDKYKNICIIMDQFYQIIEDNINTESKENINKLLKIVSYYIQRSFKPSILSIKDYEDMQNMYNKKMHISLKRSHIKVYNFLQKNFGESFIMKDVYDFYNPNENICDKCGNNKNFLTYYYGYDDCKYCKINLKNTLKASKQKMYEYICNKKYNTNIFTALLKDTNINEIIYSKNIKNIEELYLYLTGDTPVYCPICGKKTEFITYKNLENKKDKRHYKQFCSLKCRNIWWADKQRCDNTTHRMTEESIKAAKEKLSNKLKNAIKNGKFTPNVTNSWCHSKISIGINETQKISVRSSWEALFLLLNKEKNLCYENIRIPYFSPKYKKDRIYIVDFCDLDKHILYEIKPISKVNDLENAEKEKAAKKWAELHNYQYKIITENYFNDKEFKLSLLKYTDDKYKEKLYNIIKRYKFIKIIDDINYEN